MAADTELTVEAVAAALPAERSLGEPLQVFPITVSTEALALSWAHQDDAPEGALVVADAELSARGRRGAVWTSRAGRSLAFSVVLRPGLPPEGEGLLWLLGSLAAAEGVAGLTGLDVRLKWPNDLRVGGRGLGCVKVDAHLGPGAIESAVLTVRLNVGMASEEFPDAIREEVTSLAIEGADHPRTAVLAAVLAGLERRYGEPVATLLDAYRARCDTIGARVRAELMPAGEAAGRGADVDERGGLVVETGAGSGTLSVDVVRRLRHV